MSKNTEQDVLDVVEKALEVPAGTIKPDTVADEVEEWDSVGHLSILTALDGFFEGKVAGISEMSEADSIPKILDAFRKHSLI